VILQFGLKKPAFRICVNTPTTHGSIGLTTGLDPALTLGCGGWGGNITSDNISPRHLLNIKRLAYEIRPAVVASPRASSAVVSLPQASDHGIPAATLAARIDQFLVSRGFAEGSPAPTRELPTDPVDTVTSPEPPAPVADFLCEEDVRTAMRSGRKLVVGEKTILTPSARELGEAEKIFLQASWPH
jgi:acetaldehyde dehydrogenase (acetylating)